MGTMTSAARLRHDLSARLDDARARSDELFAIVRNESMYDRPISERHRIIFYVGHLEAFDWNLLADRAFGLKPFQRIFDQLFSFGIDPVGGGLPSDTPSDWPRRDEITSYVHAVRDKLDEAINEALSKPDKGHPQLRTMLEVTVEHRLMHAETLTYMLHRLPSEKKIGEQITRKAVKPGVKPNLTEIPAGRATLGLVKENGDEFGWDNEMEAHEVDVPAFSIEKCNVTNGDYLRFIQAGGYKNRVLVGRRILELENRQQRGTSRVLEARWKFVAIPRNVWRSAITARLAGLPEPRRGYCVRDLAGKKVAD